jgi:hypothetical protein
MTRSYVPYLVGSMLAHKLAILAEVFRRFLGPYRHMLVQ